MPDDDFDTLIAVYEAARDGTSANGHHGDGKGRSLDVVDWADLFAGIHDEEPIVEGIAFRGRWTSFAARPKAGKSTLTIAVATALARGREPFGHIRRKPITVLYCDAEMGRVDMHERLEELDLKPCDLALLHYVDLVPKLDTVEGAALLVEGATDLGADLVVIDGVNGAVQGAEKDDTTWRAFYDWAIAPLKRAGMAIVTNDNLGKDHTLGPRGSSVKMDKPDAVIEVVRTDDGVTLRTTHRRTAAYPLELHLRLEGVDGDRPMRYRHAEGSWPIGTEAKAAELDEVGVPLTASRRAARRALAIAGRTPGKDDVLGAAIRFRKAGTTPGTTLSELLEPDSGTIF